MKPLYTVCTNERTPFAEHVPPVFKYFGALTNLVGFLWREIGSPSQKQLAICLLGGQKKAARRHRSRCEQIGTNTIQVLRRDCRSTYSRRYPQVMECSHHCLKVEMKKRQSASWSTFMRRRVLTIQCVVDKITLMSTSILPSGKWSFVEVRSAKVPRDYENRFTWKKVFEFLFNMKV
ncbi:hypothetical protein BJV82DRAFT_374546 [Fennellomyces sp. T-0311]|nr:hypothetical protein BJV82DRAFT_374546 [Fennellomyces sp. T-0311]